VRGSAGRPEGERAKQTRGLFLGSTPKNAKMAANPSTAIFSSFGLSFPSSCLRVSGNSAAEGTQRGQVPSPFGLLQLMAYKVVQNRRRQARAPALAGRVPAAVREAPASPSQLGRAIRAARRARTRQQSCEKLRSQAGAQERGKNVAPAPWRTQKSPAESSSLPGTTLRRKVPLKNLSSQLLRAADVATN
jgi:hypothetical protein